MELLITMPIRLIKPTNAKKENDHPERNKAIKEPLIPNGIAEKMIKGCVMDLN